MTDKDIRTCEPSGVRNVGADASRPHLRGCARSWAELTLLLRADLWRYDGRLGVKAFWKHFLFTPGYNYTVWMRLTGYLKAARGLKPLYALAKWRLLASRYKYGIAIPEYTEVGPGLFINRFGGIYVNGDAVIGANVNMSAGVMLGQTNRGALSGSPTIGDRVYLAHGGKVIGRVSVGDEGVVAVNSVVTKDVPPRGVAGGIPAKIISDGGSDGYTNRLVPTDMLAAAMVYRAQRSA
ncbi:MAG: hexapeptide transferase [Pacificimonas sp.]